MSNLLLLFFLLGNTTETEFGSIKNEVDTKYNKTCPGAGVIND